MKKNEKVINFNYVLSPNRVINNHNNDNLNVNNNNIPNINIYNYSNGNINNRTNNNNKSSKKMKNHQPTQYTNFTNQKRNQFQLLESDLNHRTNTYSLDYNYLNLNAYESNIDYFNNEIKDQNKKIIKKIREYFSIQSKDIKNNEFKYMNTYPKSKIRICNKTIFNIQSNKKDNTYKIEEKKKYLTDKAIIRLNENNYINEDIKNLESLHLLGKNEASKELKRKDSNNKNIKDNIKYTDISLDDIYYEEENQIKIQSNKLKINSKENLFENSIQNTIVNNDKGITSDLKLDYEVYDYNSELKCQKLNLKNLIEVKSLSRNNKINNNLIFNNFDKNNNTYSTNLLNNYSLEYDDNLQSNENNEDLNEIGIESKPIYEKENNFINVFKTVDNFKNDKNINHIQNVIIKTKRELNQENTHIKFVKNKVFSSNIQFNVIQTPMNLNKKKFEYFDKTKVNVKNNFLNTSSNNKFISSNSKGFINYYTDNKFIRDISNENSLGHTLNTENVKNLKMINISNYLKQTNKKKDNQDQNLNLDSINNTSTKKSLINSNNTLNNLLSNKNIDSSSSKIPIQKRLVNNIIPCLNTKNTVNSVNDNENYNDNVINLNKSRNIVLNSLSNLKSQNTSNHNTIEVNLDNSQNFNFNRNTLNFNNKTLMNYNFNKSIKQKVTKITGCIYNSGSNKKKDIKSFIEKNFDNSLINTFEILCLLGKGSFGEVYKVKLLNKEEIFALKIIPKEPVIKNNLNEYIITEKNIIIENSSVFIMNCYKSFQTQTRLYMMLEYFNNGDLGEYLNSECKMSESMAKFVICEVILALENLHNKGILYRDLKPENLLLDNYGHIVLTDFGLAKSGMFDKKLTNSFCGSIAYLAPEVINKEGHSFSVDWYLLGVLFYELLMGIPPFYCKNK